jgi:hypothetical protein
MKSHGEKKVKIVKNKLYVKKTKKIKMNFENYYFTI